MGHVALHVADLGRAVDFYQRALGMRVHGQSGELARLGAGGPDLLHLHARPGAPRPGRASGLYHFAILVPSRRALARTMRHFAEARVRLRGASDHLVSEAIYLDDVEGNGIEVYRDRPRSDWKRDGAELRMTLDPLDLDALIGEAGDEPWEGLPTGTVIGHVHLQVSQIDAAEAFYRDVLGFDAMAHYGDTASFLSAGGYHHHLAINTWHSLGAAPPPAGAAGLREYAVVLPDDAERERVVRRVEAAGLPVERRKDEALVRDPSGNAVLLATRT